MPNQRDHDPAITQPQTWVDETIQLKLNKQRRLKRIQWEEAHPWTAEYRLDTSPKTPGPDNHVAIDRGNGLPARILATPCGKPGTYMVVNPAQVNALRGRYDQKPRPAVDPNTINGLVEVEINPPLKERRVQAALFLFGVLSTAAVGLTFALANNLNP